MSSLRACAISSSQNSRAGTDGRVMDWLIFSIMVVLLCPSAFFAASETALTGASRASMLRLSKQGNRDADLVSDLIAERERLIGALLVGNNMANIAASAL